MQSITKDSSSGLYRVNLRSERGFVLIVAVLACMVLLAVGILALTMSGQDIRISSRVVGDKKSFSACESGMHKLITDFDPANLVGSTYPNIPDDDYVSVDAANDPASQYSFPAPAHPTTGPGMLPLAGYSMGGGQVWGQTRYDADVTGKNTNYGSEAKVEVGLGYGPVEMTTSYQ